MKMRTWLSIGLGVLMFASISMLPLFPVNTADACDIAVISGDITKSGKPIIWKNRDHGPRWEQEVRYFPAVNSRIGGSIRVIDRSSSNIYLYSDKYGFEIMSGGANEAGFAITNTTVYELNPIKEVILNSNHLLMEKALEECATVEEFKTMIDTYRDDSENWNKTISGNFAVLDANGGAELYEIYSEGGVVEALISGLDYVRYDANDDDDAPLGFVNRTNSHFGREISSDDNRQERGTAILTELWDEGVEYENDDSKGLTLENIILRLSKDVCGDEMPPENPNKFNTYYCISRYMTNIAFFVEGVTPGNDPDLTAIWVTLGEPSAGVTTPHFVSALDVTPYAWAESGMETDDPVDDSVTCALNQMMNDLEIDLLYTNNWDYHIPWITMDRTIDYEQLLLVQEWTIPLEKEILKYVNAILKSYEASGDYDADDLYDLSHYAARFAYFNYSARSTSAYAWEHEEEIINNINSDAGEDVTDGDGSDDGDDGNNDDGTDGDNGSTGDDNGSTGGETPAGLSDFMIWLLNNYSS